MTTKIYKIKDEFLELIKKGIKKHEYRLNKNIDFKIGDVFFLQSEKQNLLVKIKKIENFNLWEDAIIESDFGEMPREEILKICKSFYSFEDVKQYGIVRFGIEKVCKI